MKKFFQGLITKTAAAVVGEVIAVGVFFAVVSIVAFFGGMAPAIDLFSHFRWQYIVFFVITAAFALLGKRYIFAGLFVFMALLNGATVAMLWLPPSVPPLAKPVGQVSILDMNVEFTNENFVAISSTIEKYKPDVIVLEELTPAMLGKLKSAMKDYPFQFCVPENDPFGIGILSKTKLDKVQKNPLKTDRSFIITADIIVGGKPVTLIATHMFPPISGFGMGTDSTICERLPGLMKQCRDCKIMVGDFNATPWSHLFRRMIAAGKFDDSEQGHGMEASWLTLQLPIDHCIYTSDCRTLSRELGAATGSDHLPVFCRIAIGP